MVDLKKLRTDLAVYRAKRGLAVARKRTKKAALSELKVRSEKERAIQKLELRKKQAKVRELKSKAFRMGRFGRGISAVRRGYNSKTATGVRSALGRGAKKAFLAATKPKKKGKPLF